MIEQWLQQAPKSLIALVVLVLLLGLFVWNDPPRSVCDMQIEAFNQAVGPLFKKRKSGELELPSKFEESFEICKKMAGPGGCTPFFTFIRTQLRESQAVQVDCRRELEEKSQFIPSLRKGIKVMVFLAWGGETPESPLKRRSLIENSDFLLFCQMESNLAMSMSAEKVQAFRQSVLTELPDTKKLKLSKKRELSLFAESCPRL